MSKSARSRAKSIVADFRNADDDDEDHRSNPSSRVVSRPGSRPGSRPDTPTEEHFSQPGPPAARKPPVPLLSLGAKLAAASSAQAAAPSSAATGGHEAAGEGSAAVASLQRCLVYCRLRPTKPTEYSDGGYQLVQMSGRVVSIEDKRYEFDGNFDGSSTQEQVFEAVGRPCIDHALKGFRSALMAYGQTGTGKSFTVSNTRPGQEGIVPRAAAYLFDCIAKDSDRQYTVTLQLLQIYRDNLGDLMSDSGKEKVDIICDKDEGVTLPGCSAHVVTSREEFMRLYEDGNTRRVTTATAMNPESSRGHSALVVWVKSASKNDPSAPERLGKFSAIDLAGYERFSKTGVSNANPIMKDEAKTINASLLSLGHVVTSLSNGDKHIPWRNAKLTRLLQDSIGGRSRTTIILTVGPSSEHLHETTNTLQFGQRAMAVKVAAKVTVTMDYEKLAAKLQAMLDEKEQRINVLEIQVASNDAERAEMLERHRRDEELLRKHHEEEIEALRRDGASAEKLLKLAEQYEVEVENLKEQQLEEVEYQEDNYKKEIIALATEQQRQEQLRATEMTMAQERIIKEFEAKLAQAREGTNDDLIRAITQLSQKDAVLAARASEIAKLHEHISALAQQLRESHIEPVAPALIAPTFLDITQVEEVQERQRTEIEAQHVQLVDFRCQIDRLNELCNERAVRINELVTENGDLRRSLEEAGVSMKQKQQELSVAKVSMVDRVELETLRVTMQSDIDAAQRRVEALEAKLEEKTAAVKDLTAKLALRQRGASTAIANDSLAGTMRGSLDATLVLNPNHGVAGTSPGPTSTAAMSAQSHAKLSELARENANMRERIAALEAALEAKNIPLPPPSGPAAAAASGGGSTAAFGDAARSMRLIEELRDEEFHAVRQLAHRREEARAAAQAKCQRLEALLASLNVGNPDAASDASTGDAAALVASLPFEEFARVIAALRKTSTALIEQLVDEKSRTLTATELSGLLQEKDEELVLKDETLLSRTAHIELLQKQLATLEDQLDKAGVVPTCRLPEDVRRQLEDGGRDLGEMAAAHEKLRDELAQHQAEKDKMQSVLERLTQDRAREAQVFATYKASLEEKLKQTEEKAKMLEEKEMRIQKAMGEIVLDHTDQEERTRQLEAELRLVTRQMMENQAKLAEEKNMSLFDRFKAKIKR